MKDFISAHFDKIVEVSSLVFIFVFATFMLAHYQGNEEMARWIENGAIITVLARGLGGSKAPAANTTNTQTSSTTPDPSAPEAKGTS
jgi:hypothetical protein